MKIFTRRKVFSFEVQYFKYKNDMYVRVKFENLLKLHLFKLLKIRLCERKFKVHRFKVKIKNLEYVRRENGEILEFELTLLDYG